MVRVSLCGQSSAEYLLAEDCSLQHIRKSLLVTLKQIKIVVTLSSHNPSAMFILQLQEFGMAVVRHAKYCSDELLCSACHHTRKVSSTVGLLLDIKRCLWRVT